MKKILLRLFVLVSMLLPFERGQCETASFFTSIPPAKYLLDQITGGEIESKTLIPQGSTPHSYSPTPKDIIKLSKSTLYFSLNAPFEIQVIEKVKTIISIFNIVDCSVGTIKRKSDHVHAGENHHHHGNEKIDESRDPHIWNDPDNLLIISSNMYNEIKRIFPDRTKYKDNFNKLQKRLRDLKDEIAQTLANIPNRTVLVYHPSLGHYADAFSIEMITVEEDGKFPSPKKLIQLTKKIKEKGVRSLIIWPVNNQKQIETLAETLSVSIIFFDPLSYDVYNNLLKLSEMIRGNVGNNKQ